MGGYQRNMLETSGGKEELLGYRKNLPVKILTHGI